MLPMERINIDAVIAHRNPKLAKRIPQFVMRYLRRILHVEEINDLIQGHSELYGVDFASAMVESFQLKVEVEGAENLLAEKRAVFAANHPLGGLDGLALLSLIGEHHGSVITIANDFLLSVENLRELFIPVNKFGSSREYFSKVDEAYASDDPYMIFPAGLCSRKFSFGIFDLQWKKSFVKKARQFNRPVVLMCVTGKNSNFFYNLARLRKLFRIKFNVEMIYLVDEMMKQRNKIMKVLIAPPIAPEVFDTRFSDWEWAAKLRQHVYQMLVTGKITEFDPDIEPTLPDISID